MRHFSFFCPGEEVEVTRRNLPHWEQSGICYLLTFRTYDSLPAEVMEDWLSERNLWLEAHGIDSKSEDWHRHLADLSTEDQQLFHRHFSKRMHDLLDDCHGECLLRRADLRDIVMKSLHHFDGERYVLGPYVIMPNHVHVLVAALVRRD